MYKEPDTELGEGGCVCVCVNSYKEPEGNERRRQKRFLALRLIIIVRFVCDHPLPFQLRGLSVDRRS